MQRNRLSRIGAEATWVAIGQLAAFVGGFVTIKVLTVQLGPAAYGQLALGIPLLQRIFSVLVRAFLLSQWPEGRKLSSQRRILLLLRTGIPQVSLHDDAQEQAGQVNTMGMTNGLMERLAQAGARGHAGRTIIACVRYGNAMYSRGSVIPLFVEQIHRKQPITITDPSMTRFLLALSEAIELVIFDASSPDTHPRTRKRIEAQGLEFDTPVELHRPFSFTDYVALQLGARAVLSDSGTITEESSILGFAALNIRETHGRHEGMDEAAVMLAGVASVRVLQALEVLLDQRRDGSGRVRIPADYAVPNVSKKVVRILLSYTDYVNHTIWHK